MPALAFERPICTCASRLQPPEKQQQLAFDNAGRSPSRSGPHHRERDGRRTPSSGQSRSPSPRSATKAQGLGQAEASSSVAQSERMLSPEELDTFLDLIYKHHPEPMTAENMRRSVDALYHDWEQFCSRRQVPVSMGKKPLMDEYAKIFNGAYGPEYQAKARQIAHELSQRAGNASISGDSTLDKEAQRRDSSSRRSNTRSVTDEDDSDDDEAEEEAMGGDIELAGAQSSGSKKKAEGPTEGGEAGSSKKSNIAQVGRNGLAVLPPGLFDILRNHLRDDILSSIMPSVRNDLTEQTRELFLQNQDLFGRLKEMEDRIRNQDLWIRHLLSQNPADMSTPPVGPPMGAAALAGGEPVSSMVSKARPYSATAREPAASGRHLRHGPATSESEPAGGPSAGDYFGGVGPMSPRQPPRNEARHFQQQGMAGPHPYEGRAPPAAVAGPAMSSKPGHGPGPSNAFGSGRWDTEAGATGAYKDHPPADRWPPSANEAQRRPGSWQSEPQSGRGYHHSQHPGERMDGTEGRYEPPAGPQHGNPRVSFAEHRRLSSFSGGAGLADLAVELLLRLHRQTAWCHPWAACATTSVDQDLPCIQGS